MGRNLVGNTALWNGHVPFGQMAVGQFQTADLSRGDEERIVKALPVGGHATTLSFGEPAASLNQRLDEMGPYYRAIFGRLTQVLAIVENAASKNPPRMTPAQFETTIENLESSAAWLREAANF